MKDSYEAKLNKSQSSVIKTFETFAQKANYSLLESLLADPESNEDGLDHVVRQVSSGHYVPVKPTPILSPEYVTHSHRLFKELGLSQSLANDNKFSRLFSGDMTVVNKPMKNSGWATGYALSIYGTEYVQQCPYRTGNAYGDGRAISVFEGIFKKKRWEMQLKGGGPTPFCRGADGRAVLRSSVREFLAQESMNSLGVPTSRSLTLYTSKSEKVLRPWYSENSTSSDPDILINNPVAITTRVAPSFLRVGQIELFARRARNRTHHNALIELNMIVKHLISRNYHREINTNLEFTDQLVELAFHFRQRLTSLVANWIRVGYCQGNFNSDNCAAGGYTLDYGPFGFCELFDQKFQPWTGGGEHFSFFNQPAAAEANYHMFWLSIRSLVMEDKNKLSKIDHIRESFSASMKSEIESMWAKKLGLETYNSLLFSELLQLMSISKIDYTIFFRELSCIPEEINDLKLSFYENIPYSLDLRWNQWLQEWRNSLLKNKSKKAASISMKKVNPKYTLREWFVAPSYQEAESGDYTLIKEIQDVMSNPYEEQSLETENKYYQLRPKKFFNKGGISHYSCSS